jgi:hypothetical protein
MEKKAPTLRKIGNDDINKNIALHIAQAEALWQAENPHFELSGDIKAFIQKKVVKEWFRGFEQNVDQVKARFADDLVEDDEKWPKVWMIKDTDIYKRLGMELIRPWACNWAKVMNHIWEKTSKLDETRRLAQFIPTYQRSVDCYQKETTVKGELETEDGKVVFRSYDRCYWPRRWVSREYILTIIGAEEIAQVLNSQSLSLGQKYIKAFEKSGAIMDTGYHTGRPRDGGRRIFAIGVWVIHGTKARRIPFLTNTKENRLALAEFSLQWE